MLHVSSMRDEYRLVPSMSTHLDATQGTEVPLTWLLADQALGKEDDLSLRDRLVEQPGGLDRELRCLKRVEGLLGNPSSDVLDRGLDRTGTGKVLEGEERQGVVHGSEPSSTVECAVRPSGSHARELYACTY
jgi:hypothetical protein